MKIITVEEHYMSSKVNDEVRTFLENYGLDKETLEKIAHKNAEKLLNIK